MNPLFTKLIKFGIVGTTGVVVDFGITWILKEKIRVNKYIANSMGFLFAASSNYILNRIWTFRSHDPEVLIQFSKFLLISMAGLGLSNGIIWLLTEKRSFNFYLAKAIAILIVMLWNFYANYRFTF